jgi:DNA-binding transcriptional LysR family regulator
LGQHVAVRAGLGIATLPDFLVEEDLRCGALRAIRFDAELAPVVVYALVRADGRKSPRIQAVVEHLGQTVPLRSGA